MTAAPERGAARCAGRALLLLAAALAAAPPAAVAQPPAGRAGCTGFSVAGALLSEVDLAASPVAGAPTPGPAPATVQAEYVTEHCRAGDRLVAVVLWRRAPRPARAAGDLAPRATDWDAAGADAVQQRVQAVGDSLRAAGHTAASWSADGHGSHVLAFHPERRRFVAAAGDAAGHTVLGTFEVATSDSLLVVVVDHAAEPPAGRGARVVAVGRAAPALATDLHLSPADRAQIARGGTPPLRDPRPALRRVLSAVPAARPFLE
jgi:hypothetical protein